jgi:pimeloyl-ACP methyl ester carboxylesterase
MHSVLEHRGCRLAYDLRGEGPPVLLIQGVGVHGDGWRPQIDALSAHYRCLSFDNRGLGRSQPLGAPLTVEQMAEDARALLVATSWTSAHVVGHSLGGLIALQLALDAPDRVRSLALLCTSACGRDLVRFTPWTLGIGLRTKLGSRRQRRHAFLEIVMPPDVLAAADRDALAERLAHVFGYDLARQPLIALQQTVATRSFDATARLDDLARVPTLVVSAAQDRMAPPECGRRLAARIPNSRYAEFPEAAHGLTIQCADRVNALLLEHLAQAERASV